MSRRTIRNWQRQVCPVCDGVGILQTCVWDGDGYDRVRYPECEKCDGEGWIVVGLPKRPEVPHEKKPVPIIRMKQK